MKRSRIGKAPALLAVGLLLAGAGLFLRGFLSRPPKMLPPTGLGAMEKRGFSVPHAMWVWDARLIMDSANRSHLIQFCRSHRVGTLYLSAYDLRSPMDEHYREFNRLAHRAGLQVHALAGDPRWGKPQYHRVPMEWIESVLQFNAAAGEEQRFDGIHTDVEVYLLSKSWKENPAALLGGYLDLNAKMASRIREQPQPVHLGVDLPFWFDDDTAYRILWHGQVKVPTQHVMDTVDSITVMAYRNFAEGDDGTVHLVSLEMDYGDRIGKKVTIGQETQENLYPPYVTFGGTSCKSLKGEMVKMEKVLSPRPSFGGFAIHHYESYKKLCSDN